MIIIDVFELFGSSSPPMYKELLCNSPLINYNIFRQCAPHASLLYIAYMQVYHTLFVLGLEQ